MDVNTIVFDLGGVIINLNVPRCVGKFKRLMVKRMCGMCWVSMMKGKEWSL